MIKNFVLNALLLSSLSAFAAGDSLAIDEVKKIEILKDYQPGPPVEQIHINGSSQQLKFIAYVTNGRIHRNTFNAIESDSLVKLNEDPILSKIDPKNIKELEIVKLQNNEAILFIRTKRGKKLEKQIPETLNELHKKGIIEK